MAIITIKPLSAIKPGDLIVVAERTRRVTYIDANPGTRAVEYTGSQGIKSLDGDSLTTIEFEPGEALPAGI